MTARTYTGRREIVDELGFPDLVDPGFFLGGDLEIRRDDGGFWVVMRADFEGTFAGFLTYRVENLFVDEKRVDSTEFLDVMRRYEAVSDGVCGEVIMAEDPGKTADIDIPFETWVTLRCVEVEEITVTDDYGFVIISEMKLSRYNDEVDLVESSPVPPLPGSWQHREEN